LLDSLAVRDSAKTLAIAEVVFLPQGKILYEPEQAARYAYFPLDCAVSLLCITQTGTTGEVAVIGREGMVGINSFLGGCGAADQAVVQSSGYSYRVSSRLLRDEFQSNPKLQQVLLRYTQSLLTQMAQRVVCNRYHTLDQQLCRWLLTSLDRASSNELVVTQEFIAKMLGVRREGITTAAAKLHRMGFISCRRGHITINHRDKLEGMSCECYEAVNRESERIANTR
jgi:CRP-like cAMP-binding protein